MKTKRTIEVIEAEYRAAAKVYDELIEGKYWPKGTVRGFFCCRKEDAVAAREARYIAYWRMKALRDEYFTAIGVPPPLY